MGVDGNASDPADPNEKLRKEKHSWKVVQFLGSGYFENPTSVHVLWIYVQITCFEMGFWIGNVNVSGVNMHIEISFTYKTGWGKKKIKIMENSKSV